MMSTLYKFSVHNSFGFFVSLLLNFDTNISVTFIDIPFPTLINCTPKYK